MVFMVPEYRTRPRYDGGVERRHRNVAADGQIPPGHKSAALALKRARSPHGITMYNPSKM